MLLRHPWLAPLMQPPTESDAKAIDQDRRNLSAVTEDPEVADWANERLELLKSGQMHSPDKPALHAAPLDAVPGSPLNEDVASKKL